MTPRPTHFVEEIGVGMQRLGRLRFPNFLELLKYLPKGPECLQNPSHLTATPPLVPLVGGGPAGRAGLWSKHPKNTSYPADLRIFNNWIFNQPFEYSTVAIMFNFFGPMLCWYKALSIKWIKMALLHHRPIFVPALSNDTSYSTWLT